MSDPEQAPGRFRRILARVALLARAEWMMWIGFILVMLFVALLAPYGGLGDVQVYYEPWADGIFESGQYPGITFAWVYPLLATVPIVLARLFGPDYSLAWILMVQVLDAVAFFTILRVQRSYGRWSAGWWWICFIGLFGALTVTRLDSVAVPLCIVALLIAVNRPVLAAGLLTVATWIKVWPVAFLGTLLAVLPKWWAFVVSAVISAAIILVALFAGAGSNVFSFATAQGQRGLEIGAPVASIWMWLAYAKSANATVIYNQRIQAFEVVGDGSSTAGIVVTILTAIALAVVALLIVRARNSVPPTKLIALGALGLAAALIVFNKVGSPQYILMLCVPIVAGLAVVPRAFDLPALTTAIIAAITQVIFPWYFVHLYSLTVSALALVTVRNLLLIALFCWVVVALYRAGSRHSRQLPEAA